MDVSSTFGSIYQLLSDISAGNDEFEVKILVDQLEIFETLPMFRASNNSRDGERNII